MTNEIPMIVIGEPKEDNLNKLDGIFKKLGRTNKECDMFKEYMQNHSNRYVIIELLDELADMQGCKNTFENRYKLFTINRDLKQLGSPLHIDNWLTYNDMDRLPHDYIYVSREDIIEMHINLRHKQSRAGDYLNWYPTKRNIRALLSDLMANDVIVYYVVEDLFDDITNDEEWNEVMDPDDRIRVIKIC